MVDDTKVLKLRLLNGFCITLSVEKETSSHYFGFDKYNNFAVISKADIDSLLPLRGGSDGK